MWPSCDCYWSNHADQQETQEGPDQLPEPGEDHDGPVCLALRQFNVFPTGRKRHIEPFDGHGSAVLAIDGIVSLPMAAHAQHSKQDESTVAERSRVHSGPVRLRHAITLARHGFSVAA